MVQVFISIGSNINAADNIRSAVKQLQADFAPLRCSTVYETLAVGFDGDPFLNLVLSFETELAVWPLYHRLRQIEADHGRRRDGPKFSSRPLDLDIILYGDLQLADEKLCLPSPEIETYAFVLGPLAELIPDEYHPLLKITYKKLWALFESDKRLRPVVGILN